MEIDLVKNTQPEVTSLVGETKLILNAGERIRIKVGTGASQTILDENVPAGKYWVGGLRVAFQEEDE